jgi:hypothetical protein
MNNQGNTEQKEQCWRYTIPDFKLYYRGEQLKQHSTGIKTDMKTSGTE